MGDTVATDMGKLKQLSLKASKTKTMFTRKGACAAQLCA